MGWTTKNPPRQVGAKALVKLVPRREQYGAIEIPDEFRKQSELATVLAAGPDAPAEVKPGALVLMGKFNGLEFDNPDDDASAERGTYRVASADMRKRGAKLPTRVMGYTHQPFIPDIYAVVELEEGDELAYVIERTATDVPKARFAK